MSKHPFIIYLTKDEINLVLEHMEWAKRRSHDYYTLGELEVHMIDNNGGGLVAKSPVSDYPPVIAALLNGLT